MDIRTPMQICLSCTVGSFSDSHARAARGNARARLGKTVAGTGSISIPSLVLVLPLAGLGSCLTVMKQ